MALTKHILIDEEITKLLEKNMLHRRESYNSVLHRLLKLNKRVKNNEKHI